MSPHSEAVPLRRQSAGDLPAPFGGNSAPAFSLNQVEAVWPRVLEAVKAEEMSTGMFLAEASLVEVSGDQIVAGFPEEFKFHKEMVEKPEKKKMIEEFLGQFLAAEVQIQFVATRIQTESRTESPGGAEAPGTKVPDIVRQAMDIFQNSKIIRMD